MEDLALVTGAVRVRRAFLQPYAVAAEDMLLTLQPSERAQLAHVLGSAEVVLVSFALQVDRLLGNVLNAALRDELTADIFKDLSPPDPLEIAAVIPGLRDVVGDRAHDLAEELGSVVARKIKGARDAVAMSADPVSQASNSLIELIDRLLRTAFTDNEVLAWLEENYPANTALTYVKDGGLLRPTKRAQALCFVFGGQPKDDHPQLGEMLASVIVGARSELQGLKHADTGAPEELDQLGRLMGAVQGFFALGVRLAWGRLSADALSELHRRVDPKTHAPSDDRDQTNDLSAAG